MRIYNRPLPMQKGRGPFMNFLAGVARRGVNRVMNSRKFRELAKNRNIQALMRSKLGQQLIKTGKNVVTNVANRAMEKGNELEDKITNRVKDQVNKTQNELLSGVDRLGNKLIKRGHDVIDETGNQALRGVEQLSNGFEGRVKHMANRVNNIRI